MDKENKTQPQLIGLVGLGLPFTFSMKPIVALTKQPNQRSLKPFACESSLAAWGVPGVGIRRPAGCILRPLRRLFHSVNSYPLPLFFRTRVRTVTL